MSEHTETDLERYNNLLTNRLKALEKEENATEADRNEVYAQMDTLLRIGYFEENGGPDRVLESKNRDSLLISAKQESHSARLNTLSLLNQMDLFEKSLKEARLILIVLSAIACALFIKSFL